MFETPNVWHGNFGLRSEGRERARILERSRALRRKIFVAYLDFFFLALLMERRSLGVRVKRRHCDLDLEGNFCVRFDLEVNIASAGERDERGDGQSRCCDGGGSHCEFAPAHDERNCLISARTCATMSAERCVVWRMNGGARQKIVSARRRVCARIKSTRQHRRCKLSIHLSVNFSRSYCFFFEAITYEINRICMQFLCQRARCIL